MSTILVIEDDDMLNAGICFNIQNNGWEAIPTFDLKTAEETIKNKEIDLILLDVNLPDGNGFEFSKTIKKETNAPFIFLTAHNIDEEILNGFDLGAEDYITKPFNIKVLLKKIEVILKRNNKIENDIIEIKDLKIDLTRRMVFKNEEKINLTPTEFDLLRVFIENRKILVTREILLDKLWDSKENFVDEHTLTINMSRLRSKLDKENDKYIKTVYGVGYQWIGD